MYAPPQPEFYDVYIAPEGEGRQKEETQGL